MGNASQEDTRSSILTTQSADDLVSVTVRKTESSQKAGIGLIERKEEVVITKVVEDGLFFGSEVEVGDKVLSINGIRLKHGEGARHIIKRINASMTVTLVVKKSSKNPTRRSASLSPGTRRKSKLVRKAIHRNEDGSMNLQIDPRVEKFFGGDDDFDQIEVKANKLVETQDCGLEFIEERKMIFVSAIAEDSVFRDSNLELGDRVVSINGMNFMTYSDKNYATKLLNKPTKRVTLVIEKGHESCVVKESSAEKESSSSAERKSAPRCVPKKSRSMPSDLTMYQSEEEPAQKTQSSSSTQPKKTFKKKSKRDSTSDTVHSDGSEDIQTILSKGSVSSKTKEPRRGKKIRYKGNEKAARTSKQGTSKPTANASTSKGKVKLPNRRSSKQTTTKPKISNCDIEDSSLGSDIISDLGEDSGSLNDRSFSRSSRGSSSFSKPTRNSFSESARFEHYDGDYMRVTVKKESEKEPGIEIKERGGKFYLSTVPKHEKRITVGCRVLAIDGNMNIKNAARARDMIKRRFGEVVLIIDFNSPDRNYDTSCPCCGQSILHNEKTLNATSQRSLTSVAESVMTTKTNNRSSHGPRTISPAEIASSQYNYEDYDTDSD